MDKDIVFTFESPDADAVAAYKILDENFSDIIRKLDFVSTRADELEAQRNDSDGLRDQAARIEAHDTIVLNILDRIARAFLSMDAYKDYATMVMASFDNPTVPSGTMPETFCPGDFIAFDYGKFGLSFGIFRDLVADRMHLYLCFPGGNGLSEQENVVYHPTNLRRATPDEIAHCTRILRGDRYELDFPKRGDYVKMTSRDGATFCGKCEGISPRFLFFYASAVWEDGKLDPATLLFNSEILRSRIISKIERLTSEEQSSFESLLEKSHRP